MQSTLIYYIALFGGSLTSYAYFWSIFFRVEKTAYKAYPIVLIFFTSLVPGLISLLLEEVFDMHNNFIEYFVDSLSPIFTIQSLLENIVLKDISGFKQKFST